MRFSEVLGSLTLRDGVGSVHVPEDWMQGRSVFGGLQSALALRAMRALVPADLPIRALQTTFIAPVGPIVSLEARVLRTGKNVVHAEARIVDAGQTSAVVLGVFGRARASKVELVAKPPAATTPFESPISFPYVPGITPSFIRHFNMRWMSGTLPYTGSRVPPYATIEASLDDTAPVNETHVPAIADSIPPLALSMLTTPAPGSSATWTLEFLADRFDGLSLAGWLIHAELKAGRDGYTSQYAMVCAPGGHAVALSHQVMTVFG